MIRRTKGEADAVARARAKHEPREQRQAAARSVRTGRIFGPMVGDDEEKQRMMHLTPGSPFRELAHPHPAPWPKAPDDV